MMSEVSTAKPLAEPIGAPGSRLIEMLDAGDVEGTTRLTAELAVEVQSWSRMPDFNPNVAKSLRIGWVNQIRLRRGEKLAEQIEQVWLGAELKRGAVEARAKEIAKSLEVAEREEPLPAPMTYRELKALMAKPEADQPKSARPIAADKIEPSSGPPAKAEAVPAEPKAGVATLARPKSLCAPGLLGEIADFALGAHDVPQREVRGGDGDRRERHADQSPNCWAVRPSRDRDAHVPRNRRTNWDRQRDAEDNWKAPNDNRWRSGVDWPRQVQIRGRHREISSENPGCGVLL